MWFWYNPQIIFYYFFWKLNLALFPALSLSMWMDRGYLVGATPPTVLYRLFWNFTGVLVLVWKYACGFDIILRLFLLLFSQVELSHFLGIIYNKVNGQGIPCGRNSSYILYRLFWNFTGVLVMAWRYACGFDLILRLFFIAFLQVELSHFPSIIFNNVNRQRIPCGPNSSYSFFYTDSFETSLVFWSWSGDMHVV